MLKDNINKKIIEIETIRIIEIQKTINYFLQIKNNLIKNIKNVKDIDLILYNKYLHILTLQLPETITPPEKININFDIAFLNYVKKI